MKNGLVLTIAAIGAFGLSACGAGMGVRGDGPTTSIDPDPMAGGCNATNVAWAVGKSATPENLKQIKGDSGATVGRVIQPNQAVTMDYSPTRVNVHVDAKRLIKRVTCG